MWSIIVAVGTLVCALMAVLSKRLIVSALWLAGASAMTALLLYMLGAPEIAVIELSVGAGLVTVLFVFAINIAGDQVLPPGTALPRWLAGLAALVAFGLLLYLNLPALNIGFPNETVSVFTAVLWKYRTLDMLLQLVLIFAGVMAVVGLLSDDKPKHDHTEASQ